MQCELKMMEQRQTRQRSGLSACAGRRQRGLSIIESMVSLALVAFGLLAYAGVYVQGLRGAQESYFRAQATVLSLELADSVRANRKAWDGATYYDSPTATDHDACRTTSGCSASDMAQDDFFNWTARVAAALPSGGGTITRVSATGEYVITVTWTSVVSTGSFVTRFMP